MALVVRGGESNEVRQPERVSPKSSDAGDRNVVGNLGSALRGSFKSLVEAGKSTADVHRGTTRPAAGKSDAGATSDHTGRIQQIAKCPKGEIGSSLRGT